MLFLGKPEGHGLSKWFLDATENVYLEVFDSVTGKRIAFKAISGYPCAQMPSPLPPFQRLLALDFPEVTAPDLQSASTPETLDLLFRTRDQGYNGGQVSLSATFTNLSADRMELSIDLLICRPQDGKTWQARSGLFKKDSRVKDSPAERTLTIDPGDTVDGTLVFDLADLGIANAEGHELSGLPKENLFEVGDSVSGKTVWCAIRPGYPPGTDMRLATVVKNSGANSANSLKDESKDSK